MRSLLLPSLATALAVPAAATLAGVDPFGTVGQRPLLDSGFGVALAVCALGLCWLGHSLREGQMLAVVVAAWGLSAVRFQQWAQPGLVALSAAAGVVVVLGAVSALAPPDRGGRLGWLPLLPTVTVLGGLAFLVHVLGYQPFAQPGCAALCVETWAPLADWWGPRSALGVAVGLEWLAVLVALVALFAAGVVLSWRELPVAVAVLGAAAADSVVWALWWDWPGIDAGLVEDRLRAATVAVLTAWLGTAIVRRMAARRGTRELVRRLTRAESFPGVVFAVPGSDRWVGYDGQPGKPVDGGVALPGPDGTPSVSVPSSWRAEADLSPVDRFVLDSTRLAVVARARVSDLRASQSRIVAAADAERRRIERDLHDGVQQQLVGAGLHLAALRDPELASAQRAVREAAAALRDISHGALLAVLSTEGLMAALEDLTAGTAVELEWADLPPLEPSVERAAYDLVGGVVHAANKTVTVRIASDDREFTVTCTPSPGLPRQEVLDRVAATGGWVESGVQFGVKSRDVLRACWPCAS